MSEQKHPSAESLKGPIDEAQLDTVSGGIIGDLAGGAIKKNPDYADWKYGPRPSVHEAPAPARKKKSGK